MSGATPDADILGLLHAGDGAHGLRARAPDTLVPLRPPLTFNLAFRVPWWAPDQAPRFTRLDGFEYPNASMTSTRSLGRSGPDRFTSPSPHRTRKATLNVSGGRRGTRVSGARARRPCESSSARIRPRMSASGVAPDMKRPERPGHSRPLCPPRNPHPVLSPGALTERHCPWRSPVLVSVF